MEKKKPDDWLKMPQYEGLIIYDPDGWDRKNYEVSWNEEITEEEFNRRLMLSTCMRKKEPSENLKENKKRLKETLLRFKAFVPPPDDPSMDLDLEDLMGESGIDRLIDIVEDFSNQQHKELQKELKRKQRQVDLNIEVNNALSNNEGIYVELVQRAQNLVPVHHSIWHKDAHSMVGRFKKTSDESKK